MIDFVILLLGLGVAASFLAGGDDQPVNFLKLGAGSGGFVFGGGE